LRLRALLGLEQVAVGGEVRNSFREV
jgi:hypothetical protein